MNLDEDAVRQALESLNEKNLAGAGGGADSRVTKYEHRLQEAFNFSRPEIAVLCTLFLRGPQTLANCVGGRNDCTGLVISTKYTQPSNT